MCMNEHLEALYPATTRKEEIDKIFSYVQDGTSCQIVGAPGVGRSNLLGFLAYNRNVRITHVGEKEQSQYHFVLVNFAEVQKKPLFDVYKFLFLELITSLHERKKEEEFLSTDALFKKHLAYQDELVLFQGLKQAVEYLTHEKNLLLVFLFERFETYLPMISSEFFTALRRLRDIAKYRCSYVFSTTRPLEEVIEPDILGDFYDLIADHAIYIPLSDTESLSFRLDHFEHLTKTKINEQLLKSIYTLTAGHGKLTRLALETSISIPKGSKDIASFLLSQKSIQQTLLELWNFFTPEEQQHFLHPHEVPLSSSFLEKVGLEKNNKLSIPLLQAFIDSTIIAVSEQEKIIYEEKTKTIMKGSVALSDTLTSAEFRLLRYLVEHPDTILEREEIIQTIWNETQTTFGVTDQALDQLLFRLRKKIENNPTHPQYIQTVKGRGILFHQ